MRFSFYEGITCIYLFSLTMIHGEIMSARKPLGKKIKLIAARKQSAPRWADIKKYSLKRARTRRIRVSTKHWRRGKHKV